MTRPPEDGRSASDADARQRAFEHARRRRELEDERAALVGVERGLEQDARRLTERVEAERTECMTLRESIAATRERAASITEQNRAMQVEVAQSETHTDIMRRRVERLQRDIEALQREVEDARDRVDRAHRSVDQMTGSVLRMDYKIKR